MVNTRRKESNGSPEGPRHRTRGSVRVIKEEIQEESGSSSVNDSDSEDLADSSSNAPLKPPILPILKNKVPLQTRQLRSKVSFIERKYNAKPLRSHKRISLDERRTLAVYSTRNMNDASDENESEEELFSVRGRRTRRLIRMNRIQRRTALSLRPIRQKCYTDPHSPLHFNSDSGGGVRRSKRSNRNQALSWLDDSQMHKVGYPTLTADRYSEEDSRDCVPEDDHQNQIEISRRVTRHSNGVQRKSTKYLFDYEETLPLTRTRRGTDNGMKTEITSRRDSNDKENKKDDSLSNGRLNGRLRSSKGEGENKVGSEIEIGEDSNHAKNQNDEVQKPTINGETSKATNKKKLANSSDSDDDDDEDDDVAITSLRPRTVRANHTLRETKKRINSSSEESEEERQERKYALRDRRPKPAPKTMQKSVRRTHNLRQRRHFTTRRREISSSSSDSSSDIRNNKTPKSHLSKNDRMKTGAGGSTNIDPIKPETLDKSVKFNSIGGLDTHIQCLKEMILLPMMYPEVFKQFQVQPPRGVLFHGPPGTGKTLIARALANECSFGKKKVAFFLRKGADLLSKWIGESEKQLRLLFEQAVRMKPSIIFFDELDGLAPVRSSRQDQVHASIVSTLLALMDGLTDRGEVIVIGATNRIDAIDPALRRPGRFDRELFFPLPSRMEREEILKVHVSNWSSPPSVQVVKYLAENTVGYCGSDLRALCSEAVIHSFRRTYPQVYDSEYRLLLEPRNVKVEKVDFMRAKSLLVPASHRITQGLGRKLFPILDPLLEEPLKNCFSLLEQTFPHGFNVSLAKVKLSPNMRPAQLLITGEGPNHGQTTHLAPAVLFKMEHIHAYLLDLTILHQETCRSAEEACIQIFNEARRNVPSIIYIPNIDKWWKLVKATVKAILLNQLTQLDPQIPILFLATSDCLYPKLPPQVQSLFSHYRKEILELKVPDAEHRRCFFRPLLINTSCKAPRSPRKHPETPPCLPRAPTPPPEPLDEEQKRKMYETEEHTLRELRIFLRDMCKKLANNKLFFMFTKPVDTEEVPDYTTIIKQPMDLETMMTKVDFHRYESAKDFLNDIELICQNALEYNPARSSADKQIRHRACSLRDYAYTLIKTEMDTDFEEKCQQISKKRRERKHCPTEYLPPFLYTPEADCHPDGGNSPEVLNNGDAKDNNSKLPDLHKGTQRKRKRWQRGCIAKKKRKPILDTSNSQVEEKDSSEDEPKELEANDKTTQINIKQEYPLPAQEKRKSPIRPAATAPLSINCDIPHRTNTSTSSHSPKRRLSDLLSPSELLDNPLDFDDVEDALNETNETLTENSNEITVTVNVDELEHVLDQAVKFTDGYSLVVLLDLYNHLSKIIKKFSRANIRTSLPKELSKELGRFKKGICEGKKLSQRSGLCF